MTAIQDLLSNGYFPRELPPPFSTNLFGEIVGGKIKSLPDEFKFDLPKRKTSISQLEHYNLSRPGMIRRRLSFPNPVAYLNLITLILNNWADIKKSTHKSSLSASKPILNDEILHEIERQYDHSDLPYIRIKSRATGRYLLETDISQCYLGLFTEKRIRKDIDKLLI